MERRRAATEVGFLSCFMSLFMSQKEAATAKTEEEAVKKKRLPVKDPPFAWRHSLATLVDCLRNRVLEEKGQALVFSFGGEESIL